MTTEEKFNERTNKHIELVEKWYYRIIDYTGISEIASIKRHDRSKFYPPEYEQYVLRTNGLIGSNFEEAVSHHVFSNTHHPEYWDESIKDKTKMPTKKVFAVKMPYMFMTEMVADWFAMSEEMNTDPKDWADSNIDKRWVFSSQQISFIYDLINNVWFPFSVEESSW